MDKCFKRMDPHWPTKTDSLELSLALKHEGEELGILILLVRLANALHRFGARLQTTVL